MNIYANQINRIREIKYLSILPIFYTFKIMVFIIFKKINNLLLLLSSSKNGMNIDRKKNKKDI